MVAENMAEDVRDVQAEVRKKLGVDQCEKQSCCGQGFKFRSKFLLKFQISSLGERMCMNPTRNAKNTNISANFGKYQIFRPKSNLTNIGRNKKNAAQVAYWVRSEVKI